MASDWRTVLRDYATTPDPTKLPRTRYLHHNDDFLTIFDCYPKAKYHFLVLPRVRPGWDAEQLQDLRSVLKNQERAAQLMKDLQTYANERVKDIENEMVRQWKFKWGIIVGFHPNPSLDHLHLHIISNDLCGEWLKKKRHFNSFNPKRGFFVSLEEVLDWCEATPESYEEQTRLIYSEYDGWLKSRMFCHLCGENNIQTMPRVKEHLQKHWDDLVEHKKLVRERQIKFDAYVARKRARAEAAAQQAATGASKDGEKASTSKSAEVTDTSKNTEEAGKAGTPIAEKAGALGDTDESDVTEPDSPKVKRQRTEERSDDDDAALFEAAD